MSQPTLKQIFVQAKAERLQSDADYDNYQGQIDRLSQAAGIPELELLRDAAARHTAHCYRILSVLAGQHLEDE